MHLDSGNRLKQISSRAAQCPHCGAHAHMTPISLPDFDDLQRLKPAAAGIVFHCGACHAPVFRKYRIKRFGSKQVEFYPDGRDVEKRDERITRSYLPEIVAAYFDDAMGCYRAGLLQAFAAMCRMTIQTIVEQHGDSMQLKLYDQIDDIASLAELDDEAIVTVQDILFDTRAETIYQSGQLDRGTAAILLEVMKDLLHQVYIRRGRLSKALRMRQFFARSDERQLLDDQDDTIASLPVSGTNRERPTGTDQN